jgi:mannose-6-phosphate isomerase-like protein (cupin superfamily)
LLLITAGESHEIKNNSDETLRTLNIYAPPEFQ